MALSLRLLTPAFLLAASFGIVFTLHAPSVAAQETPAAGAPEASASSNEEAQLKQIIARLWWNRQAVIETATLTSEQRSRLDALFLAAHERRKVLEVKQREGLPAFAEALKSGDQAAQNDIASQTAQRMTEIARVRTQLMIDGVAVLSDEQRTILAEKHPFVFNRPWLGFYSGTRSGPRGTVVQRREPGSRRGGQGRSGGSGGG